VHLLRCESRLLSLSHKEDSVAATDSFGINACSCLDSVRRRTPLGYKLAERKETERGALGDARKNWKRGGNRNGNGNCGRQRQSPLELNLCRASQPLGFAALGLASGGQPVVDVEKFPEPQRRAVALAAHALRLAS
jgi:hypothetical protein